MSINWHLDAEPAPAILVLPPDAASLDEANAAIELWEHYSGKTLDGTQRLTVQMMMAQKSDGTWAAATTGREMPRQNGKGDEVEVPELWGLVQRSEAILHTVHDAVLLASQAQQRMLATLEGHADLRRLVKRKWQGTGQQMIEMRNGGVIWYRTRTGGGGRGVDDIDRLVVDEAQHATEEHLAAVAPTLLANPNPQMNVLGTAALAGRSDWWWSVRKRALEDDPGAFGYVGHTAEKVSLDDQGNIVQQYVNIHNRELWRQSNPSLVSGRGQGIDFLEEQLRRLGEASFGREHLGIWDPPEQLGGSDIDMTAWARLEDIEQTRPSPVAFSVVVSEDRKWASIGLAGVRSDGHRHLQIVQAARGTGWVPARLAELAEEWKPVGIAINPGGPAGSLLAPIEAAGVKKLHKLSTRDYAQSCGMFADGLAEGTVRHMGQPQVAISLGAARKKPTGEAYFYESNDASVDISPLRALTMALFALEHGLTSKTQRSGKAAFY